MKSENREDEDDDNEEDDEEENEEEEEEGEIEYDRESLDEDKMVNQKNLQTSELNSESISVMKHNLNFGPKFIAETQKATGKAKKIIQEKKKKLKKPNVINLQPSTKTKITTLKKRKKKKTRPPPQDDESDVDMDESDEISSRQFDKEGNGWNQQDVPFDDNGIKTTNLPKKKKPVRKIKKPPRFDELMDKTEDGPQEIFPSSDEEQQEKVKKVSKKKKAKKVIKKKKVKRVNKKRKHSRSSLVKKGSPVNLSKQAIYSVGDKVKLPNLPKRVWIRHPKYSPSYAVQYPNRLSCENLGVMEVFGLNGSRMLIFPIILKSKGVWLFKSNTKAFIRLMCEKFSNANLKRQIPKFGTSVGAAQQKDAKLFHSYYEDEWDSNRMSCNLVLSNDKKLKIPIESKLLSAHDDFIKTMLKEGDNFEDNYRKEVERFVKKRSRGGDDVEKVKEINLVKKQNAVSQKKKIVGETEGERNERGIKDDVETSKQMKREKDKKKKKKRKMKIENEEKDESDDDGDEKPRKKRRKKDSKFPILDFVLKKNNKGKKFKSVKLQDISMKDVNKFKKTSAFRYIFGEVQKKVDNF